MVGLAVVQKLVEIVVVDRVFPDTELMNPDVPWRPSRVRFPAHRQVPSSSPRTKTWKTNYGGRRDSDNRVGVTRQGHTQQ